MRPSLGITGLTAVLIAQLACTDGGSPDPFGAHCPNYGPDFSLAANDPFNTGREADCSADPECRTQAGLYTWEDPFGWCHSVLDEYVACIPDVIADPNACPPGTTGLPGGPTWGSPAGRSDLCYRLSTPCMPEGWSDCSDPAVITSQVCL